MNMASCKWHFRLGREQAHYNGDLIAGGEIAKFFGDVATELMVRQDGQGGLLATFENIEFKAPLFAGDYVEIHGKVVNVGNRSRKLEFEMYRIGSTEKNSGYGSPAKIDEEHPELIARGSAIGVVRK